MSAHISYERVHRGSLPSGGEIAMDFSESTVSIGEQTFTAIPANGSSCRECYFCEHRMHDACWRVPCYGKDPKDDRIWVLVDEPKPNGITMRRM